MKNYRAFIKIWMGQFISILGTSITSFVLSIWIVNNSNSATQAIFAGFFDWIPLILFAGLAGYIADKYNKKTILSGFDIIAVLTSLILLILVVTNNLNIYYIYVLIFISTICDVFQSPVNAALVPILVPNEKLQRANGLISLNASIKTLLAPILGGILLTYIGIQNIIILDISTFFISMIILFTIPARIFKISKVLKIDQNSNIKDELLIGFKFLSNNKGFLLLIIYFSFLMFFVNSALITAPLYLILYYGEIEYSIVLTLIGLASVLGSIYASTFRKVANENLIKNIFLNLMLFTLALLIISLRDNFILIIIGYFMLFYTITLVSVSIIYIKQLITPKEYMGRVSSSITLITSILMPLTFIIIGLMLDKVLIPLYESNSKFSLLLKTVLLDTAGLPYRLIYVISFIFMLFITLITFNIKSVKNLVKSS